MDAAQPSERENKREEKMKAIVIEQFGGVDQLQLSDYPASAPLPGQVQIAIQYSGVNPVDWKIREGKMQAMLKHQFPIIMGWEASGIITQTGKESHRFEIGDEVYAYCRSDVIHKGTYAEYISIDEASVARKPDNITFAEAAAIPLAGLTAWQVLFDVAHLQRGQTILIHAAAGGVGSFATQFARHAGATVIATASSNNHEYLKKLGATHVIDYTKEDFVKRVEALCPEGVDVVFDAVGKETLRKSVALVKKGGYLISIVEQEAPEIDPERKIHFAWHFVTPNGKQLEKIAELIDKGAVVVPALAEMRLEDAAEAQTLLKQGHTRGKIVLKVRD